MPPRKRKTKRQSLKKEVAASSQINILNTDCLVMIFSYLNIAERIKMEKVCKLWREASLISWVGMKSLNFEKSFWGFSYKTKVNITNKILHEVLLRCGTHLREIRFPTQNSIFSSTLSFSLSQRGLCSIWTLCPNLKILDFGTHRMRSSALSVLADYCHKLEVMWLELNKNISDQDLSMIFKSKKNLRAVHLYYIGHATISSCLEDLPENSLEELTICNCHGISNSKELDQLFTSLLNVTPRLKKLCKLDIHNIPHNISEWSFKSCTESFNSMAIRSCYVTYSGTIQHLTALEHLQELTFCGNVGDTDDFLILISQSCTKLVKLVLKDLYFVTDKGLSAIALNMNLRHMEIINMDNVTGKNLENMHHLQYFKSRNCRNIVEANFSNMLVTAANDSRSFELSHSYIDKIHMNRYYPPFNGTLLQTVAAINQNHKNGYSITTKLYFENRLLPVGERKIKVLLDRTNCRKNNM